MVQSVNLHLLIDGACHNVARRQTEALVVLFHERLAIGQLQHGTIAAHSLRDEVGRMCLVGIVKHSGMELYKLHVSHRTLGTIDHSDAVARSNDRVGGCQIDGTTATRTHHRTLGKIGVHLLLWIEHIGTIALDIGRAARHAHTLMVLGDDFYSKMVLLDVNIRIVAHSLHQPSLDFGACIVSVMQNAELRVSTLTVQVELTVFLAVEVDAPLDEFLNLFRSHTDHLFHSLSVTDKVAGNKGICNMLVKGVELQISHRCYATLCKRGVGLIKCRLANHANFTFLSTCHLQCVAHTGYAGTDNQKIVFINHPFLYYTVQNYKIFLYFCKRNEEISVFTCACALTRCCKTRCLRRRR